MAWTLCKRDDVRSIHPISEAELQDLWGDAVEAMIRRHLGEPYLGLSQSLTELYSGDGSTVLMVKYPPISSVTSLIIDDFEMPTGSYIFTESTVQLLGPLEPADGMAYSDYGPSFTDGSLNVELTYLSGRGLNTDGIIDDPIIRLTAASMIVAIAQYKGRAGADASIKWGAADQKDGEPSPVLNAGLTSHLNTIMKRMLRRTHVRIS